MRNTIHFYCLIFILFCLLFSVWSQAAIVSDGKGLTANWRADAIMGFQIQGKPLAGVTAKLLLQDPRTGQPASAEKFTLTWTLKSARGALWLEGLITAAGREDAVVDLVLRVEGVSLPTGDGVTDLLLAAKLVNKLPICPLRCLANGQDVLALAMPAEAPYVYKFQAWPEQRAVEMRLPLGFTAAAAPLLRLRAPFQIVLYQTNPRWHFRSALAEYYRLFPRAFARKEKRDGGWFFANEVSQIPNPQHYAFFEGQGDLELTHHRGLGMFPYNETGSETIQLPGPTLPKDYEDAMRQMEELERAKTPAGWMTTGVALDENVRHSGSFSLRATSDSPRASCFARQIIVLKTPIAEPVVVSGFSKAENVVSHSGVPTDYSIYVDCLLTDGSYQFGQCAVFRPGTHDWEKAEFVIQPRHPLADLRVYTMFRNHTGAVWFDDVRIFRQSQPEENLLENGDFESLGKRTDIQFVRDNALTDAEGRYRVFITDNWGSDVPPPTPLSLLRFICNVDPDLRAPENRPTPAGRALQMFDALFARNPGIDGCYIDGAGAWTCWYINHRRDHFPFASHPFTYDPQTYVVGQHGRLAMWKWLRLLQERYHPLGKTIMGNMGPTTEAWDSYTALDIIGIESSHFHDRALLGYHRFGAYQKPVLTMNFINLHKLDERTTAEEFVLASAQWGEFPSTGRFVREGYQSYGDVCHSYYPALVEMSRAGWEPEPLCEGVRAERFGRKEPLYFTVRAPHDARKAQMLILPPALKGLKNPVVMDAVQLTPIPSRMTTQGLQIEFCDGADVLTILRVSSPDNVRRWLLERAALHCEWGARVRAVAEHTPRLRALAQQIRLIRQPREAAPLVTRLQQEISLVKAEPESLEKTSLLTELRDAERALGEWLLQTAGAELLLEGERIQPVGQPIALKAHFRPGRSGAECIGLWARDGRNILRRHGEENLPAQMTPYGAPITIERRDPGAAHINAAIRLPIPGAKPIVVVRAENVFFAPVVRARVERLTQKDLADVYTYKMHLERIEKPPATLKVQASGEGVYVEPAEIVVAAHENSVLFNIRPQAGMARVVPVFFTIMKNGQPVETATAEFRHVPPPPPYAQSLLALGATIQADSSYPGGYSPEVAIDGVWETTGLHWTKKAWASQDMAQEEGHWLEITLPRPMPVAQAWIYWAIDNERVFSSRHYDIELWEGQAWRSVAQIRDNPLSTVTISSWPAQTTQRVRIRQLRGGGPQSRPNIMWIAEIFLLGP